MLPQLKRLIEARDATEILNFIHLMPDVLDQEDDNGSSGFMLLAYSQIKGVFAKAKELKSSFSFHEAIVAGKIELVKEYLSRSVPQRVNRYSNDGFSPLALAAFFNQTEIAKLLLNNGADPNRAAENPSRVNALHAAVAKENFELCALFLENGADPNAVQTQNVTPLHSAVHRGNLKLVQLLVGKGANPDQPMENGNTARDIANREGQEAIRNYFAMLKK